MNRSTVLIALCVLTVLAFVGCGNKSQVNAREGGLEGNVVDRGGVAIPSARVFWVYDPGRSATTDASGHFLIDNLFYGDQVFTAEKTGYVSTSFKTAIYSGNVSVVGKVVLATAAFFFTDITVKDISATTALVSCTTSEFTNCVVQYGETTALGATSKEPDRQSGALHAISLTGLKPETRYYYKIVGTTRSQSFETSPQGDFTTLSATEDGLAPAAPKLPEVGMTEKPNQVTVTWAANSEIDLKGYNVYRTESPAGGFSKANVAPVPRGTDHYIDAGIIPGKKYFYRVSAIDQAGNESGGSDIVSILVPGDVNQLVHWSRALSPYVLVGDLDIRQAGFLEIEPGVEVRMADYDALLRGNSRIVEIRVEGAMVASAAGTFPITFSSSKPTPAAGDWGGIAFNRAVMGTSYLNNVTIAHAKTGLSIFGAPATCTNLIIKNCETGVSASNTSDLTIASLSVSLCSVGAQVSGNVRLNIQDCTFTQCPKSVFSSQNDTVAVTGNNFWDYSDTALYMDELGGVVEATNNLFVSPIGVGIHVIDKPVQITYNTFDSAMGIRIDQGTPVITKNIIFGGKSIIGSNGKGIEYLATSTPLIVFGPNDVASYPTGASYIGCASTTDSLAKVPAFMKDNGGNSTDYRLRVAIPDNFDPWGIYREQ